LYIHLEVTRVSSKLELKKKFSITFSMKSDNIWITSDTHYMHKNICRGVSNWKLDTPESQAAVRDFETLEEMNLAIVNNINSVVDQNDFLIHLGDWSFGGFERIEEFRSMINCKNIALVLGNHDHHIQSNRKEVKNFFTLVANYEELKFSNSSHNGLVILCHYPIASWRDMRKGSLMLHGHCHLKGEKRFGEGKRMDVGLCGSPEFRPYHIEEILKLLNEREEQGNAS
jgi:calcineurin-like phosphoesterase family protein